MVGSSFPSEYEFSQLASDISIERNTSVNNVNHSLVAFQSTTERSCILGEYQRREVLAVMQWARSKIHAACTTVQFSVHQGTTQAMRSRFNRTSYLGFSFTLNGKLQHQTAWRHPLITHTTLSNEKCENKPSGT